MFLANAFLIGGKNVGVIEDVLSYVDRQIGKSYSQSNRYGENSFDCSSLVYRAFEAAGVKLVHKDTGGKVDISSNECYAKDFELIYPESYGKIGKNLPSPSDIVERYRAGDLVFCCTDSSTARENKITHVMIVNQYGGLTHAANPKDGVEKTAKNTYATKVCAVLRYAKGTEGAINGDSSEKNITSIKNVYAGGTETQKRQEQLKGIRNITDKSYEILIQHENTIQIPTVCEEITLEYNRQSSPGKLECKVMKYAGNAFAQGIDMNLNFQEGDSISFQVNGIPLFYGYIFQKRRSSDGVIQITAYDQLRYFKNKDTMIFGGKASELLTLLARDYHLQIGEAEDTVFSVENQIFDNKTLFDILQDILERTLIATGKQFVVYDDFGFLFLKDMEHMVLEDFLLNETNAKDFDYTSSIDKDTYNKIKLAVDNKETGVREIYTTQDGVNMAKWGTLQFYEKVDSKEIAMTRLEGYLELYNRKTRSLQIKEALGDIRVKGGTGIYVNLDLGDIIVNNRMWVEKVKHTFKENEHLMDLTMKGWEFTE